MHGTPLGDQSIGYTHYQSGVGVATSYMSVYLQYICAARPLGEAWDPLHKSIKGKEYHMETLTLYSTIRIWFFFIQYYKYGYSNKLAQHLGRVTKSSVRVSRNSSFRSSSLRFSLAYQLACRRAESHLRSCPFTKKFLQYIYFWKRKNLSATLVTSIPDLCCRFFVFLKKWAFTTIKSQVTVSPYITNLIPKASSEPVIYWLKDGIYIMCSVYRPFHSWYKNCYIVVLLQ